MRIYILLLIISYSSILASETQKTKQDGPIILDIYIMSAVIAPMKPDGSFWDATFGNFKKGAKALSSLSIQGVAVNVATNLIATNAPSGSPAPDIIGKVIQKGPTYNNISQFSGKYYSLTPNIKKSKNTYQPNFDATFIGWPIHKDTFFQIDLLDKDFLNNDDITNFTLTREDLLLAKKSEKPIWLDVSERTQNSVLFIKIKVTDSLKNSTPQVRALSLR